MAIEARDRTIPDWFTRVRTRQMTLPRFQRFEAWSNANITQIFNTVIQDLPVGALLVLEVGNDEPFVSRTIKGAPEETGERVTEQLLDGQQRITALWRGLSNNYEDRTYFLYLSEDEETGMPYYIESISRSLREGDTELRPFWANKPEQLWKRRMIPLELCAPDSSKQFREWAKLAILDGGEREDVTEIITEIRTKFTTYNLPYLALPIKTSKETALDVFLKMNTSAQPLSIYDIVVAQVEAGMDKSLHDLVADARGKCPAIENYYPLDELSLYASALIQGRAPTNATYMSKEFSKSLLANWDIFVAGISHTVAFLEEERIFDSARLPTEIVVPVLTALWARSPKALDGAGRARTTMRKYLWRSCFTNRYEKSTGSRSLVDYNQLNDHIQGSKDSNITIFNDEMHPLPSSQELIDAKWPTKKDRLARAILAVALKHRGLDLADGSEVNRENLKKREYHHLFPVSFLEKLGRTQDEIYRSMNCALVTWQTNRTISGKEPEKYLTERLEGTELGEPEIRDRLESHLIPYDEMVSGDYDKYLGERAKLIHSAMLKLCDGVAKI